MKGTNYLAIVGTAPFLLVLFAPLGRGEAKVFFEGGAEVAEVGVAAASRDGGDGLPGVLQLFLGLLHAQEEEFVADGLLEMEMKKAVEMASAAAAHAGQFDDAVAAEFAFGKTVDQGLEFFAGLGQTVGAQAGRDQVQGLGKELQQLTALGQRGDLADFAAQFGELAGQGAGGGKMARTMPGEVAIFLQGLAFGRGEKAANDVRIDGEILDMHLGQLACAQTIQRPRGNQQGVLGLEFEARVGADEVGKARFQA
jgi:hypothetical protein